MKKNNYFQFIRGICIILVILIHILYMTDSDVINYSNIILRRIINFATATFILLSGYFTRVDSYKEFYRKKIKRIILPLIIWNIIYCVIANYDNLFNLKSMLTGILLGTFGGHLYYMYVLIQLFAIAPLLIIYFNKVNKTWKMYIPLFFTPVYYALLTFCILKLNKPIPMYNYWFFGWISYYYLGIILRNVKFNFNIKKLCVCLIIFLFISIFEGVFYYKLFLNYAFSVSQLTISNFFYSFIIGLIIYNKKSKIINKNIVSKFGDYSFGIYFSHIIIIRVLKKINSLISLNYYTNVIVIFIFTLLISYIVNKVYYERIVRCINERNIRKK